MNDETITVSKKEYEFLKQKDDDNWKLESCDFAVKIYDGDTIYDSPDRTVINIFSDTDHDIVIRGQEYKELSEEQLAKIKEYIKTYLDLAIRYSKMETRDYLARNGIDGFGSTITIKLGNLTIYINGAVSGEIRDFVDNSIHYIIDVIQGRK